MAIIRVQTAQVRDVETGQLRRELVGQPVQIVHQGTSTPAAILDAADGSPIPDSMVQVLETFETPQFWMDVESPADTYLDWLDPGSGARGPVDFDIPLRDAARSAQEAAEVAASSAASLSVGVVRSINGQVPDESGALSLAGGGTGSGILILGEGVPVPEGVPAGTVIGRSSSAPPVGQMTVVTATRTTASAESASDVSLAIPSGTVAGDLLVAVTAVHTNSATATAPAGWTKLQEIGIGDSNFRTTTIWGYPVPTTGDIPAGAQLFTWNVGGRVGGAMFRVTGVDLTTPVLANGTVGTRPTDSTFTVPALPGSDGGLILEVSTGQIDNGVVVYPLIYSEPMDVVAEVDTGGGGTRLILGVAWATATAGDWPEHTVATTGNDVNAFGAQVMALRSDAG